MTDEEWLGTVAFVTALSDVILEIDNWREGELTSHSFLDRLQFALAETESIDVPIVSDATEFHQRLYDEVCRAVERLRELRQT